MKEDLKKVENAWLQEDKELTLTLANDLVDNLIRMQGTTDKEISNYFWIFQEIFQDIGNHELAAQFSVLSYPYLKEDVLKGQQHPQLLFKSLKELLEHLQELDQSHPMLDEWAIFFEDQWDSILELEYEYRGISDCISDVCFAADMGYFDKALEIVGKGLENSISDKNMDTLLKLRSRIEELMDND